MSGGLFSGAASLSPNDEISFPYALVVAVVVGRGARFDPFVFVGAEVALCHLVHALDRLRHGDCGAGRPRHRRDQQPHRMGLPHSRRTPLARPYPANG
jgi:hypothetical protein